MIDSRLTAALLRTKGGHTLRSLAPGASDLGALTVLGGGRAAHILISLIVISVHTEPPFLKFLSILHYFSDSVNR